MAEVLDESSVEVCEPKEAFHILDLCWCLPLLYYFYLLLFHLDLSLPYYVSQIRYSLVEILELSGVSEVQYKDVMMIDSRKYQ